MLKYIFVLKCIIIIIIIIIIIHENKQQNCYQRRVLKTSITLLIFY